MNNKPKLRLWQTWNMSFGFLGIQFSWDLQMANMSPIYKYLGADEVDWLDKVSDIKLTNGKVSFSMLARTAGIFTVK